MNRKICRGLFICYHKVMDLDRLRQQFLDDLPKVKTLEDLENIRIKYIGRKSQFSDFLRSIKDLSIEEKRLKGPAANHLRDEIDDILNNKIKELIMRQEAGSVLDVTMPGKKISSGHLHPLTIVENQIKEIFLGMNFSIVEGPELETEFYNFDALNFPPNHPARDVQDTFWISDPQNLTSKIQHLMRTHTSPMQIRYMQKHEPPMQIIVPGRVFRNEATDMTHEINFHQVEGLMVGKNISLANFKFVISEFFSQFFNKKLEIHLRPSYFPFVEPGVEVAIKLNGKWLEVLGAGMVHQNVFKAAGYIPGEWQGFAFGMGVERLAMLKYNIPDIRLFYSGDLRFINQF